MKRSHRRVEWLALAVVAAGSISVGAWAAERKPAMRPGAYDPQHASVELFDGLASGQLGARLILQDSTEGRVLVENRSGAPLNVRMPEAFAGVQVLAQLGGAGGGLGGGGGGGGAQAFGGGGLGGGGLGGGGGGGGGNFFSVPAERVAEVPIVGVCLEHGKPEPRAQMTYEMRPIDSLVTKPEVVAAIRLLTEGKISQRMAQCVVWHWQNDMSWEELAGKTLRPAVGAPYPYYTRQELQAAMQLTQAIEAEVKKGPRIEGQSLETAGKAAAAQ